MTPDRMGHRLVAVVRAGLRAEHARQQAEYQAELDAWWQRLLGNDPGTVLSALAEAFEDNEAAAAPLGVDGDEVGLVVLAPPESIVPERMPGTTAAGNLSLRKLPKGDRAGFYTMAVMGHVVVTLGRRSRWRRGCRAPGWWRCARQGRTPTAGHGSTASWPVSGGAPLSRGCGGRPPMR